MKRIVLLASAAVLASSMSITALAGPVGAATRSSHGFSHGFVIRTLGPAKKKKPPNVNINSGPVFSPTSVTGKKVPKSCKKKVSFTISNTTANNQDVQFTAAAGGGDFTTIDAGTEIGVCGTAKFPATAVFQLASNPSSTLTVTIT
jgi:hypothetical protein